MSITVFVWYPKQKNVGHATLKVTGGVYVSWWPSTEGIDPDKAAKKDASAGMFGSQAIASSMALDKHAQDSRNPDWASAPILGLDEQRINKWYQELSPMSPIGASRHSAIKAVGKYDLKQRQCASLVVEALLVGGLTPARYPLAAAVLAKSRFITPLDVKDIVSAMTGELGVFGAAKVLLIPSASNLLPYLRR